MDCDDFLVKYPRPHKDDLINSTNIEVGNKSVMTTGINPLSTSSVMITESDSETDFATVVLPVISAILAKIL